MEIKNYLYLFIIKLVVSFSFINLSFRNIYIYIMLFDNGLLVHCWSVYAFKICLSHNYYYL